MVEVTIRGKRFPLCLTVAALDKVNARCGGLKQLTEHLDGGGEGTTIARNTTWMLALLIRGGEDNRLMEAKLAGETLEPRQVPDEEMLSGLLGFADIVGYRKDVFAAINESLTQSIEASYSKNAGNAEQG